MSNAEILRQLMDDLRRQLAAVDQNPIIPGAVKLAVNTSCQILEILVSESLTNGGR